IIYPGATAMFLLLENGSVWANQLRMHPGGNRCRSRTFLPCLQFETSMEASDPGSDVAVCGVCCYRSSAPGQSKGRLRCRREMVRQDSRGQGTRRLAQWLADCHGRSFPSWRFRTSLGSIQPKHRQHLPSVSCELG